MFIVKLIRNLPEVFRRTMFFYRSGFYSLAFSEKKFDQLFQAWHMIGRTRGYLRSLLEDQCVDRDGKPIPWYAYPAIEQIDKWDFSGKEVLEYGSGNSTLWWAARARSVTSIEGDERWYDRIRSRMPANCTLLLAPVGVYDRPGTDPKQYVAAIDAPGKFKDIEELNQYSRVVDSLGRFDVIIIDGEASNLTRFHCTHRAVQHLKEGGLLILDNADWHPETCRQLREAGFIEIDFCGLAPLNSYASTTSVFFRRDFEVPPREVNHPGRTLGGYEWNWEPRDAMSTGGDSPPQFHDGSK